MAPPSTAPWDELFPFHLVVAPSLEITACGPSLRKVLPTSPVGDRLDQRFELVRPRRPLDFALLRSSAGHLMVFAQRGGPMQMRGQFVALPGLDGLMFLGGPWVRSVEELSALGLCVRDFALHDGTVDHLFALQLQGVGLDEARRAHQALLERQRELERAYAELAEAQAQLVHAGKMAALGQLGAGIAHELNQPLSVIGFCAGLMAKRIAQVGGDEKLRGYLGEVEHAVGRAASIVRNVSQFARRDGLAPESVDPRAPFDDALELFRRQLTEAEIEVTVQCAPDLRPVYADPNQLQQVFMNLLANARDALTTLPPDAARRITVVIRQDERHTTVSVADSGPGVPEGLIESIFNPFFTTKPVGQGTGLGLSLSDAIARRHGGRLRYERGSDGGACFTLQLPREPLED